MMSDEMHALWIVNVKDQRFEDDVDIHTHIHAAHALKPMKTKIIVLIGRDIDRIRWQFVASTRRFQSARNSIWTYSLRLSAAWIVHFLRLLLGWIQFIFVPQRPI